MNRENEMVNPYRPYDLDSGEWFYHEDIIKQIREILAARPHRKFILLHGSLGTGKTSTLKRMAGSPEMLGKNYIPLYLDSNAYKKLGWDDLLFSLYKDAFYQLKKFGFEIENPDRFKKEPGRDSHYAVASLLASIDLVLDNDLTLLWIFDEFDNLLENLDITTISKIIDHLQQLARNWSHYGLILVGNKKLQHVTQSIPLNQFLETARPIDIEEVLTEKSIKALIVKPVKGQIRYKSQALEKILWLCGKNLYFQQLICYYLVEHLNEARQNLCTALHVDGAVERLLNDNRPEFAFTWNNIRSGRSRIMISALADEGIVESRGSDFVLKENTLLDDIFGNDSIKECKILQDLGYIYEINRRRFSRFPFKIPLLGKWLRITHPFIQTVIDNIESIAAFIDLNKLIFQLERVSAYELEPLDKETILGLLKQWSNLTNHIMNKNVVSAGQSRDFLESFFRQFALKRKEGSPPVENYLIIDIAALNIGVIDVIYCFVQDSLNPENEDLAKIEEICTGLAMDSKNTLALFFYFHRSVELDRLLKKSYLNLVEITAAEYTGIILAKDPREAFKRTLLARISLQRVCPYKTVGPATTLFYGRDEIIRRINSSTNTSYAIVGARKIGKSSLLHKIKESPAPAATSIFLDLEIEFSNVKDYRTFLRSLEAKIERIMGKNINFGRLPFTKKIQRLPEVIGGLTAEGKRILFLLDEVDRLIEFDKERDYKLIRIFRTMSQKNTCQFIVAGFKELYHEKRRIENPLYNFCEEICLDPLTREAALQLITKPMASIGVRYHQENDRELILEYTACHPNLVQFFCKKLVEKIEKHEKMEETRTIYRHDIQEVFNTAYEEFIMDDVYMFFSDLDDIDRLILLMLAEEGTRTGKKDFSIEEIRELLNGNSLPLSIEQVHRTLRNLVIRFILRDEGKERYSFALPVFPAILRKRIGPDYLKKLTWEMNEYESRAKPL